MEHPFRIWELQGDIKRRNEIRVDGPKDLGRERGLHLAMRRRGVWRRLKAGRDHG